MAYPHGSAEILYESGIVQQIRKDGAAAGFDRGKFDMPVRPVEHDQMTADPYVETSRRLGDGWIAMGCKCVKFGDDHQHLSRGALPKG